MIVEHQALNYILANKDRDFLLSYGEEFYQTCKPEYKFMREHFMKYKTVPDIETVQGKFPNFEKIVVNDSKDYLTDELYDAYMYRFFADEVYGDKNELMDTIEKSATKARLKLLDELKKRQKPTTSYGIDIVKDGDIRLEKTKDKILNPDKYRYSTGLEELDMSIGGIKRDGELMVIFARTNNAKSWIAEKFAVSVWLQKGNVGFFEPEMTEDEIGYRFDTLLKNFDNHGVSGDISDFDLTKYEKHIEELKRSNVKFSVTTQESFNHNATVTALRQWVLDLGLDLLVIDGLSYMVNERAGSSRQADYQKLTELSEDLYTLSKELHIPVILVVQANRTGVRDKEGDVSKAPPELDSIFGADGIAHNATRVLSLSKNKDMLSIYIPKNRGGDAGQKLMWQVGLNTGIFTYVDNPKSGLSVDPNAVEAIREEFKGEEENF